MEANKILQADLLDILFENRNKAYGAYELRSTYPTRIKRSMMAMGAVCLVFVTGVLLANSKDKEISKPITVTDVTLSNVPEKEKVKPIVIPPETQPVQARTIEHSIPIIVPNDQVEHSEVPTDDQMENVQISNITKDGLDIDVVAPPIAQGTGGTIELKVNEPDFSKEFFNVEREAQFPGGIAAWTKYLTRNLNSEIAVENGAPSGVYKITISFLVDRDGKISEIKALNDPGFGIAQEAIRVINKSEHWTPAMQNGNNVIYRQKQSITFVVNEG